MVAKVAVEVRERARTSMKEAARVLEGFARDIKDSHTFNGKWQVVDEAELNARYEYLSLRRLARRLRKTAKEL